MNGTTATTIGAELSAAKIHALAEEISALTEFDPFKDKLIDVWGHELDDSKVYILRPKSQHITMLVPRAKLPKLFHDMLSAGCRVRLEPKDG